jgi:fructose-bisphosphate aldolase class I
VNLQELEKTAKELVAPGKGILAADESFGTIGKRFEAVGIASSEESRRAYREMLFTTSGIGEYLSGVILFEETLKQEASDGRSLAKVLEDQGIIPGIKVDKSTVNMPLSPNEKFTQALGVQGAGGALHQVAGGHHHRRRHPYGELRRGQR